MCLTLTAPSGGATFEGIHWCIIDWRRVTLMGTVHCQSFVLCGQTPEWCFTDIAETIDSTGLMANNLTTLNFWSTNSWHRTKSGNCPLTYIQLNKPYTLKHAYIWKTINQAHDNTHDQSNVVMCSSLPLSTWNRTQRSNTFCLAVMINSPNFPCRPQERRWLSPFLSSSLWLSSCSCWLTGSPRRPSASRLLSTTSCSPWSWSLSPSS